MQISYAAGLNEDSISARFNHVANGNGSINNGIGIGINSSTAVSGSPAHSNQSNSIAGTQSAVGLYSGFPGIGYNTIYPIEYGGTGTNFVPAPASSPILNNAFEVILWN
jgi:hypothetical protein